MYAFDTSNVETTLLNGQINVTIEYFDGLGNSLPSPLPNPFTTSTQTIRAKLTNSTSQDPDGACFDETQITFTVEAAAVAHSVNPFEVCDDNSNDGVHGFDTSTIEVTVLNGQTGMLVSYTDQNGNPLPSPLPNPFTTGTQDITVRVENPLSATCFDETTISFVIYEQPIANTVQNEFICDDILNNGEFFTLSDFDGEVLNGQSTSLFEVLYFESNTEAQNNNNPLPNLYEVTTTVQPIFARIQNRNNPDCFAITDFEIGVYHLPIANQPEDISVCDDDTNDGEALFDLSQQNISILNGQSATDYSISFYTSQQNADDRNNPINGSFTNTQNPQTIYVRLENNDNTDCYTTTSFQLIVNEQPVLLMDDQWPICDDDTVEIIADTDFDEYLWSTGATTPSIVVDTALDFVPLAGGVNDIRKGIRDGDGWQIALGVGIIVLDIFTLGSASLVKGAVKTGIKQGVKAYAKNAFKKGFKKGADYTTTAIGRMDDLKKYDKITNVDTWRKSGFKNMDGSPITWKQNRQWLDDRIARGDRFVLATNRSSLPNRIGGYIPGTPNGYFTAKELHHLMKKGINVLDDF